MPTQKTVTLNRRQMKPTSKTTTSKPRKGEPLDERAREYFRQIKKHVRAPRYELAARFAAGSFALIEAEATVENLGEGRRWLEALGMTPHRGAE